LEPIAEALQVLLSPVLHHLLAVADLAQVRVDATDHFLGAVAQLPRNSVQADWRAAVEGLEPRGAVDVTEETASERARREPARLATRSKSFEISRRRRSSPVGVQYTKGYALLDCRPDRPLRAGSEHLEIREIDSGQRSLS